MKLELKHLAPYLPYGLKFELLDYKCDYVGEKYGVCNGYYLIGDGAYYTFKGRDTAGKNKNNCKPILRPLSDLKKEINKRTLLYKTLITFYYDNNHIETKEEKQRLFDSSTDITIGAGYDCITFLISEHFDVFGLIEKGLAIDINTLC